MNAKFLLESVDNVSCMSVARGGARDAKAPPHGPKVSEMVHNFGNDLLVTLWNRILLDHNVSKCITFNHIFQNFPREHAPHLQ